MTAPAPPDPLGALNKTLAAEHAAVYAYGVIGARLSGGHRSAARAAFDSHRARRDRLRVLITARGGTPAEPDPAYRLPFPVTTQASAANLAAYVEDRVTAAYLELVAVDDASLRRLAALAMQESTIRAHTWRPADLPTFPGWPTPQTYAPTPTATPPS